MLSLLKIYWPRVNVKCQGYDRICYMSNSVTTAGPYIISLTTLNLCINCSIYLTCFISLNFFRNKNCLCWISDDEKSSLRWVKANILKVEVKVKVVDRAREEDVGSTGLGEEEDGEEEDTTITMATEVEEVYVIWIYKALLICYIYVILKYYCVNRCVFYC